MTAPSPSPQPPTVLPIREGEIIGERYRVGQVLGCGGMGVICAGTHVLLGTPVAIKLIHSGLKDDPEALQRFVNEARAAAVLKGEHIAHVFDVGVLPTGEPYLVMEQLEGMSLDQYLEGRGQLLQSEAVDIVLQVCEGLAEAHAVGLVHRDIKPANLFLALRPDGHSSVKILDFGIVKWVHAVSLRLTDPGKSLGSPWYMSPEQMSTPADVDARTDVWSLGVLLFELLTRRLPFEGETVPEVCASVLALAAPSVEQYREDVAPELDLIVQRCLEKEREQRIGSVNELAHALLPFSSTSPHAAAYALEESKPAAARTGGHGLRPRRRVWPLALALVASALVALAGWLQYRDPSLAVHAARAIFGENARLLSGPALGAELPQTSPPSPLLLQYMHAARARPELEHFDDIPAALHGRFSRRPESPKALSDDEIIRRLDDAAARPAGEAAAKPASDAIPTKRTGDDAPKRTDDAAVKRREAEELYGL